MTSMFDKTDGIPLSVLGPGFTGGLLQSALSPRQVADMTRGRIPIIVSRDPRSSVLDAGRMNAAWVPGRVAMDVFDRGANYSPVQPIVGADQIVTNTVTITLNAPAGVLTDPTYRGRDYRFAALAVDINTSALTTPGQVTWRVQGYLEDFDLFDQTLQLLPGLIGTARYYLIISEQTSGGAYPTLVTAQRDILATPPGVSVPVVPNGESGITTMSFTNGVRGANFGITNTFTGFKDTGFVVTALTPSTLLWDDAYSLWLANGYNPVGVNPMQ